MTAIDEKWTNLGGSASVVGNPLAAEMVAPDGIGHYRWYAFGTIYGKPSVCFHEIHGLIVQFWGDHGFETNPALGYPISDEQAASLTDDSDHNRFSDFENGVVFWHSGDAAARILSPVPPSTIQSFTRSSTFPSGIDPTASGLAALVGSQIAARAGGQVNVTSSSVESVSDYSCDGRFPPGFVHNRRHTFKVELSGNGGCFIGLFNPNVTLHLVLEIAYNRPTRTITGRLLSWRAEIHTVFGIGAGQINQALHTNLDPLVGTSVLNQTLPSGVNVLSVKVMPSGDLAVFIEPVCLIATMASRVAGTGAEVEDPHLTRLRAFRDDYVANLPDGRLVVDSYYWLSPQVVAALDQTRDAQALYQAIYKQVVLLAVQLIQSGQIRGITTDYYPTISKLLAAINATKEPQAVYTDIIRQLVEIADEDVRAGQMDQALRKVLVLLDDLKRRYLPI